MSRVRPPAPRPSRRILVSAMLLLQGGMLSSACAQDAVIEVAEEPPADAPHHTTAAPETGAHSDHGATSRWGMAPIRWGGTLSLGMRHRDSDSAGRSNERQYEARLRANSYLVQPWYARVGADLAFTLIDADAEGSSARNATSVTGTTTLNVFPLSRFPFLATLSLSDSRTDGAITDTEYRRTRLSLRQEYRPPRDSWSSFAQYDLSRLTGSFGADTVNRLTGGYQLTRDRHTVTLDGSYARNDRDNEGSVSDLVASGRHSFRASDALAIETLATVTDAHFDNAGSAGFSGSNRTLQAYSFANWTPLESPWRGTLSVRYLGTEASGAQSNVSLRSIGSTGSLNYQPNRNLGIYGALSATQTKSSTTDFLTHAETLGANYTGTPLTFGNYSYNWYGSGSFSTVSADDAEQRATTLGGGHSLNRNWTLDDDSSLTLSASQNLTATRATGVDALSTRTLNHSLGLAWRARPAEGLITYVSGTVSDSRTRGDLDTDFRLYNLQANGTWRLSPRAEASANLTWQRTEQRREQRTDPSFSTGNETPQDTNLSANLTYNHNRAFGVVNLRYSARFTTNTFQSDTRLGGNPDASRERVTRDFDQHLRYRVGRLHADLQMRIATVDGKKNALVFLKFSRDFGSF